MKQLIRFGFVGTIGFIVDALILLILAKFLNFDIAVSRFFSFLSAVLVTWILNRTFTFNVKNNHSKKREYLYYLVIQSIGAFFNYSIFIFLIKNNSFFEEYLIITLAIASLTTMFFNFINTRIFIYR